MSKKREFFPYKTSVFLGLDALFDLAQFCETDCVTDYVTDFVTDYVKDCVTEFFWLNFQIGNRRDCE